MKTQTPRQSVASRRAELMAQLFFEELNPLFLSKPTSDVGYDLLVGFPNDKAGVNTFAVEVRSTLGPPGDHFALPLQTHARLVHSNVPALLLVVDVKENQLYFAWLRPIPSRVKKGTIEIPLTRVTEGTKRGLVGAFRKTDSAVAVAG